MNGIAAAWRPVVAVLLALMPAAAHAEKRIALLIGNQGYGIEIGRLANPHNDVAVAQGGCRRLPEDNQGSGQKRAVVKVAWEDITKEFLPFLLRKTGRTYRLLSEAEWEYAARAGTNNYQGALTDGSAVTSGDCLRRVLRGGSWNLNSDDIRLASRDCNSVAAQYAYIGFRVGRTLTP